MKKISMILISLVLVIGMTVPAFAADLNKVISVSGEGSVVVEPDQATINIGVETENAESTIAQENNAEKMMKIMKVLEKENISTNDIKTINYSIYPLTKYNEKTRESELYAYRVNNTLEITIKDIKQVGEIIDAVSSAGANKVNQINFTTSRSEELYLEALSMAIKNGQKKANQIGKAIGTTINQPSKIIENLGGYTPYRAYDNMMLKSESASTPISQGQIEIKASVNLEYNY